MIDYPEIAGKIQHAILKDLRDRRRFREDWDACDEDVKKEIKREWREKIRQILIKELSGK